jgi:hypothetical protein
VAGALIAGVLVGIGVWWAIGFLEPRPPDDPSVSTPASPAVATAALPRSTSDEKPRPRETSPEPFASSPETWLAPLALGVGAGCALGLAYLGLRTRWLREDLLDAKTHGEDQVMRIAVRCDEEIARVAREIDAVRRDVKCLEDAVRRHRSSESAETARPRSIAMEPPPAIAASIVDTISSPPPSLPMAGGSSSRTKWYAEMPDAEGTFPIHALRPTADGWSLYQIEPDDEPVVNGTTARLGLYPRHKLHDNALMSPRQYLMPVCDYDPLPQPGDTMVKMITPGRLHFDGDRWRLLQRMKIKFTA